VTATASASRSVYRLLPQISCRLHHPAGGAGPMGRGEVGREVVGGQDDHGRLHRSRGGQQVEAALFPESDVEHEDVRGIRSREQPWSRRRANRPRQRCRGRASRSRGRAGPGDCRRGAPGPGATEPGHRDGRRRGGRVAGRERVAGAASPHHARRRRGGGCTASRTAHVLARLGRPGGLGDRILEAREPDLDIAAVGGSLADATTAALGS
jgi:hypothetical protein